jgi:hypothetical protein
MDFNSANYDLDMLIGRDLLSAALLVYDGKTGQIGMELPSTTHPLDSSPWTTVSAPADVSTHPDLKLIHKKRKDRRRLERAARKANRKRQ